MTMTAHRRLAPLAVALLLAAACASAEQEGIDWETGPERTDYAALVVENDNTSTVTVYAVRSGTRQRIGTLPGLRTERFEIRRSMLSGGGELRIAVSLLGSTRVYTGQPIYINEGDVLEVTISSFLR